MKKTIKWFLGAFILLAILAFGFVGYAMSTALRTEYPVGFQIVRVTDANGQPFALGVWYPTQTQPLPTTLVSLVLMNVAHDAPIFGDNLPLVIFSHGNGGGIASHADLALALASAGYIVAAPMHSGDNYADQSAVGSTAWLSGRTRELRRTIDYMLRKWQGHARINPERSGAFGFSAGGFTVLTAIGAQPDLGIVAKHCIEASELVCELLRYVNSPFLNSNTAMVGQEFLADKRIKAAVVAAPGLGFTMVPKALENIQVPVQLWSGENDINVPHETNIKPIRKALGELAEFHSVAGASHFSFLTPCGLVAPPELCTEQGEFDRKVFHINMNASVIAFFEKNMKQR